MALVVDDRINELSRALSIDLKSEKRGEIPTSRHISYNMILPEAVRVIIPKDLIHEVSDTGVVGRCHPGNKRER